MALKFLNKNYYADLAGIRKAEAYRISFDPGVRGTGMAVWDHDQWEDDDALPIVMASFVPPGSFPWVRAAKHVMDSVNSVINGMPYPNKGLTAVYLEMPQYMGQGNAGGEAVAARGDLQKLTFMAGMLASFGWWAGAKVKPYTVSEWKGQMPKKLCEMRIRQLLPGLNPVKITDHAWDAVGIGCYAKGIF